MNYAIFVYRADARTLKICMNQARAVDPAARFYLFDDAKDPIPPGDIPAGDDVHYKITYFNRRGNLNGLECVRGMQSCMLDIPGNDPVVKLDADVLLMSVSEIQRSLFERQKLAGGCQCTTPLGWAGCCYWMTKKAIREGLELLAKREWPDVDGREKYPEDVTMTRVLLYLYGGAGVDVLEFQGGKTLIGVRTCDPDDLKKLSALARGGVSIVHCGQMDHYEPLAKRLNIPIRDACALIMKAILNGGRLDAPEEAQKTA